MTAPAATARPVPDLTNLGIELRHRHRLAGTEQGLQEWHIRILDAEREVGSLHAARCQHYGAGNLAERMTDHGGLCALAANSLLTPDGEPTPDLEDAVEYPGNFLLLDQLDIQAPFDEPTIVTAVIAEVIDRLTDNHYAVVLPCAKPDADPSTRRRLDSPSGDPLARSRAAPPQAPGPASPCFAAACTRVTGASAKAGSPGFIQLLPRSGKTAAHGQGGQLVSGCMSKHFPLRGAVLSWLEHARGLPSTPQAITDVALAALPHWETLEDAVAAAAPSDEHPDLYGKVEGDWVPSFTALLGESGLGTATRLIAQGADVPLGEVADSFVAFCTGPAPVPERWLLLDADLPRGTRIPLGQYTLQTFTLDELRQAVPMPAIHGLQPRSLDLDLIADAPFLHVPEPGRKVTRRPTWFDLTGPRAEAQHWQALLPLVLWDSELLRVSSAFTVARGRRFDLHPKNVPTTIKIYEDSRGREQEFEVRDTGDFYVPARRLPALTGFCTAISAKIDAVMAGASHQRRIVNRRAGRLERTARHLLAAYQRTYTDDTVWAVEADELHLDYVIALEALLISPNDERGGIANNIRSRASALFLTPEHQKQAGDIVQRAYSARSTYVHGDVIRNQTEQEKQKKLKELRTLRLLTRQIILRWLVLTPSDTEDLAPLLDDAAQCTSCRHRIDQPLRDFFTTTPPSSLPADITAP
ncbi:hypothetical protein [Streptomyces wedmorensis]